MATRKKRLARPRKRGNVLRDYGEAIFVAAAIFLFLRSFVVQAYQIPSGSMEDTLLVGDFLVANKFLYGARIPGTEIRLPEVRPPAREDIIVFRAPHKDANFIKRCVAIEGDTVEVRDNRLYLNGERRDETYIALKGTGSPYRNWGPEVVPKDYLLMLGDNRNFSDDSRHWGLLHRDRVEGSAMFLYFSWDKKKTMPRFNRFFRGIH